MERLRDRFISAVTHELRTPLVSIVGYVDYILTDKMEPPSEKVRSSLVVVKQESERLVNLTNELLDIRRIEMGRFQLNLQQLELKKVIDDCIREIQPLIEKKKQTFRSEIPTGPLMVQGDTTRLTQAVMNLLSNASKFTPEGGTVTLQVGQDIDSIKVQVSDTGIGIRREDLTRMFEPFAAIEKPSYFKGTGLGLSVTKGLVEAHGGRAWAESEGEGKGATFTFTLPKHVKKEAG